MQDGKKRLIELEQSNQQKEWIKNLEEISPLPIQGAVNTIGGDGKATPGKRRKIGELQLIDERTRLLNEVVFDFDYSAYKTNCYWASLVSDILTNRGTPHYIFSTGGKGIHIHIFFDKIDLPEHGKKLLREAYSYGFENKYIRHWFWNMILDEIGVSAADRKKRIDSKVNDDNHLIRVCGGRKMQRTPDFKIKTEYKSLVDAEHLEKGKKDRVENIMHVTYPESITLAKFNEGELMGVLKQFIESAKEKKAEPLKNISLEEGYLNLQGVQKILEGLEPGFRNDGAKILGVACFLDRKGLKDAEEILKTYAENCSQIGDSFTSSESIQWLRWIYHKKHVFWNCADLEKVGVHERDSCDVCLENDSKIVDFLKDKNLLNNIQTVLDEVIVGENNLKMLIFILLLSKNFQKIENDTVHIHPDPQNIILSSDSSIGKTHAIKNILPLIGEEDEDYMIFSNFSKRSLGYFNEPVDNKIISIEELQGADEATDQLRIWMSEGKLSIAIPEDVKNPDGTITKQMVRKKTLGHPCFVLSTAESRIDDQLLNRCWVFSNDPSQGQSEGILDYQDELNKVPKKRDILRRRIIRDSINKLQYRPFILDLFTFRQLGIPTEDIRIRRDYKKFCTLIKCITHLHQFQRDIVTIDGQEYLVCSYEDYEIAREYADGILGSTFSGLTIQQQDLLSFLKGSSFKDEFGISDLQRNLGKSKTYWRNTLSFLEDKGFVTLESGGISGVTSVYKLNEKKAINLVTLPSAEELKKMRENGVTELGQEKSNLKPESQNQDKNLNSNIYNRVDFFVSKSQGQFQVGDDSDNRRLVLSKQPETILPDMTKRIFFTNDSKKKVSDLEPKSFRLKSEKDILEYIGSKEIEIESLINDFGQDHRENIDFFIKNLLRKGDIFEPKSGFIRRI